MAFVSRGPRSLRNAGRAVLFALVAGVLTALVLPASSVAQEPSEPPVTAAVQVTKTVTPARGHTEPQMLVHPDDTDTLVIVGAEFLSSTCHVHVSRDRGRTWTKTDRQPLPAGYQACSRPTFGPFLAAGFGIDGTLYVVNAASDSAAGRGPTDAYVARSTDLGETWEFSFIRRSTEREFLLADGTTKTAAERYAYVRMAVHPTDPNLVYAGFRVQDADTTAPPRSFVSVSTDRGVTWSEPVDVMEGTFSREEVQGSDVPALAVAPDGTIYAFTKERPPSAPSPPAPSPAPSPAQSPQPTLEASPTPDASPSPAPAVAPSPTTEAELPPGPANLCQPLAAVEPSPSPSPSPEATSPPLPPPGPGEPGAGARLLMAKSADGGATWTASVVDDSGVVCVPCLTTPEAAVDARTGSIYVVFEQSDSPPPNARDDRNIWFMRSTDSGETWTQRLRLNDDDEGRDPGYDQMFPGISLAPDGRIDVAWQDFRTDALYNPDGSGETDRSNQTCWDIFSTFSSDGGETWAPNVRVSDRSMNQFEGYAMHPAYDLRGPTGIASTDTEAHVVWSDSRGGRFELPAEDIYFASVLHKTSPPERAAVEATSLALGGAAGVGVAGLVLLAVWLRLRARRRAVARAWRPQ